MLTASQRAEASAQQAAVDGDDLCAAQCTPERPRRSRVWRGRGQCLVAPANEARRPGFAAAEAASAARDWPIVRRRSGGLTVPNGQGVLNLAIAELAGRPEDPAAVYRRLGGMIAGVLERHGVSSSLGPVPGAFCDGRYNVVVGGRKLAGTAQRWERRADGSGTVMLAHALILADLHVQAAVEAVNDYYERLGRPSGFTASAVVTLAALGVDPEHFENDLRRAAGDLCEPYEEEGPAPSAPSLENPRS